MTPLLLTVLLALGGLGLYLAMPALGVTTGRGAVVLLIAAAAAFATLVAIHQAGGGVEAWFVAFALLGLTAAIRVITHKRPVYSALYFILVIVATAGMLTLAQATFLATALVIIYAGAILVTYVFVIMLASEAGVQPRYDREARQPFLGVLTGTVLLAVIAARLFVGPAPAETTAVTAAEAARLGATSGIGTHLLTQYAVGVEVAGVLLLAAMVGAIVIAQRRTDAIDGGEER
jgi:NADH-quinone oxidoreductase subunit J